MAERFPIENLKVVGNDVYRVAPDGRMFFVRSLAPDPTANTDVFAATPPRADAPSFYASTPDQGYFGEQAVGMAAPYLENARNLALSANTMTPDRDSYVPESIQRMGNYATNMGLAGLSAAMAPVYGAAGAVGDVAKAAGVPRSEALVRDLGAMLDTAGVLPEGRILGAMADADAVPKVAGDLKNVGRAVVERANQPGPMPTVYSNPIPGIGDNGGPPIDIFGETPSAPAPRQRYVDPATGMYSKSYEAAHGLQQNVGTAEQMRKMLLNNGANEEELFYTGFDKWIKDKGNSKVTKDEIVNYLEEHAFNGQDVYTGMDLGPFTSKTYAGQGVLGSEGSGIESIRSQIYVDRERQAEEQANAYRNQVTNDIVNMGYQTLPEVTTVDDLAKLEAIVKQAKDNGRYVSPTLDGKVRRAREKVDRFIANPDSTGTYEMLGLDPETALKEELAQTFYGYERRPTGSEWLADPVPHDVMIGPEGDILPYSDAYERARTGAENPWDVARRLFDESNVEVNNMTDQQIADYMGIDLANMPIPFRSQDTRYSAHSPVGVKDYAETTYNYTDPHGILSGQNAELGTKDFPESHGFGKYSGDARDAGRLYHTRTGTLNTPEGPAHYVFEVQSDIAQRYDKNTGSFHVTGKAAQYDIPGDKRKALQEYLKTTKEYARLEDEVTPMKEAVQKAGYRSDLLAQQTGMTREEAMKYLNDFTAKYSLLTDATNKMAEQRGPLFSDLHAIKRFYGLPEEFDPYNRYLREKTYDPSILESVLAGKATITKEGTGGPKGKIATRPFTTSTNRWAPAALKNELIKAVGKDAEWLALPMGKDVQGWTNGKTKGQEGFYENILPIQLKKLIKKELGIDVQVEKIKAEGFLPKVDNRTYEVNAIRLTPELKKLILEQGFSTFKKGGPVVGSSLDDVDVFALP
jgi:hypothetical protein